MIITISFPVKNYVEVMEGWPIKIGTKTFFLEREGNVVKRVSVSFSGVGIDNAPTFSPSANGGEMHRIRLGGGIYLTQAIQLVLNWQTIVSGPQIFDIDYDAYEIRFRPETVDEEGNIQLTSFSRGGKDELNSTCDFEQVGRAFCVDQIENTRIESTSHYREGRIAFEARRYVDSFNYMFLFLETRYCDGKTATKQQVDLLAKCDPFCKSLEQAINNLRNNPLSRSKHLNAVFDTTSSIKEKIQQIVLLRGKLRHHSLKSPHRWDPNKQNEYEEPARFLGSVVGEIVIEESLADIYSEDALKQFRDLSVSAGFETSLIVNTRRLEKLPALQLSMSYPTTVISSKLCLATVRHALEACARGGQLSDTVQLEASHSKRNLDLFALELGTWAHTELRRIQIADKIEKIHCSFEQYRSGPIVKDQFSFSTKADFIDISYAWNLLKYCFDHIENRDPTTRIMNLKLFFNNFDKEFLVYRVGAQVKD